ncbi:DUF1275 family protein [Butyrivibrio sp. WCE2006]|uniref:DUF1275 family protein n=1 Tax=Butyrivibrio sp. WCE2006 TaxID=1410611 RepID=UPI0005D29BF3|nr:DUF1275 domain-containing protein [Butyrivibrio sp. WCE2006]
MKYWILSAHLLKKFVANDKVSAFSNYLRTRDAKDLGKARDYIAFIVVSALGAVIGGNSSLAFGERSIWTSAVIRATIPFLQS